MTFDCFGSGFLLFLFVSCWISHRFTWSICPNTSREHSPFILLIVSSAFKNPCACDFSRPPQPSHLIYTSLISSIYYLYLENACPQVEWLSGTSDLLLPVMADGGVGCCRSCFDLRDKQSFGNAGGRCIYHGRGEQRKRERGGKNVKSRNSQSSRGDGANRRRWVGVVERGGGGALRNPLLPGGIYISQTALSAQLGIGCVKCRWLMTTGLTAPASFNEHRYFLMKTTLQGILEVVRVSMLVASGQLTSAPTVIYGRDIFHGYRRCRVAETGMPQNTKFKCTASVRARIVEFSQCCQHNLGILLS